MFEHLFFIYLNCFLRIVFVRIIIFLLFYFSVSLPYPCPSFLKFFVSHRDISQMAVAVAVSVSMIPRVY